MISKLVGHFIIIVAVILVAREQHLPVGIKGSALFDMAMVLLHPEWVESIGSTAGGIINNGASTVYDIVKVGIFALYKAIADLVPGLPNPVLPAP
jgi:hypothetical protein